MLAILADAGRHIGILLPGVFGVGATKMAVVPTVQVWLAPEAPTLKGAMNLAALNSPMSAIGVGARFALTSGGLLPGFSLPGASQVPAGVDAR